MANARALDTSVVLRSDLTLYRLARSRYANLSGAGSALYPGRWNRVGEEAVYTSSELSGAVLEFLAHTRKEQIPMNMAMMTIHVSGSWAADGRLWRDPATGGRLAIYPSLPAAELEAGAGNVDGDKPFAVAVPCVVAPIWNVVLYPARIGFANHVSVQAIDPYEFDPRHFPENAAPEVLL